MKKYDIQNIDQLKAKRFDLKHQSEEQWAVIKQETSFFLNQFTIKGFLGEYINRNSLTEIDNKIGLVKKISSVVLPMFLNRAFFRKSGFLSKLLINITGAKIGGLLDLENIIGIFSMTKELVMDYIYKSVSSIDKGKLRAKQRPKASKVSSITHTENEEILGI